MDNRLYFSHRDEPANIYELQTYLRYLSKYYPDIPNVIPNGIYGSETGEALKAFQKLFGIQQTGEADFETWTRLVEVYDELLREMKYPKPVYVYPLDISHLKEGDDFEEIYILQIMLRRLSKIFGNIYMPQITGVLDDDTKLAVKDFATIYGQEETELVDRELWNIIADTYSAFTFND